MRIKAASFLLAIWAGSAFGQDASPAPMSAIDWLSDSVATPIVRPRVTPTEPGVTEDASVAAVSVAPLGKPVPDAVGILPVSVTGLPRHLWGPARPNDVALRVREERADMLPAMQAVLYTILLAELDPPESASSTGYSVFLARVDKLLEMGALDQAAALLERAGPETPAIFRRWFDTALLQGNEDTLCEILRATPELSPTFPARIFCLARGGDWNAAALTLETGRALDFISDDEDAILARFLDPHMFEGDPPLPAPARPTPLFFRMFEAIGEPIPTPGLPLAFAHSDLRNNIGWKARIEAGERLARTGAVSDNQLLGLYTERKPAASGGVWDRATLLQTLDHALNAQDRAGVAQSLPQVWASLQSSELEVPVSQVYGPRLAALDLSGDAAQIAFRMGLLSDQYETVAAATHPADPFDKALKAIAQGQVDGLTATTPPTQAVIEGFLATGAPVRLRSLLDDGRLGEAILRAMSLFTNGTRGDLDEITDALALFRAVGLEETARRSALQYLILERRG